MTITNRIIDYALRHSGSFSRRDLMSELNSQANLVSESSAHVMLNRLLKENKILRVGYGEYKLAENTRPILRCNVDEMLKRIDFNIKEKFPFIDYCLWHASAFTTLMQHIPSADIIFVDVEREAMESVFMHLQSANFGVQVLLNPSKKDCERYITNNKCMVIRPLVKEAPLQAADGIPTPTLEKLLVDAIGDKELAYMQGAETYHIYNNAFARYDINKKRLLRYASRRNRKDKVQSIIDTINP